MTKKRRSSTPAMQKLSTEDMERAEETIKYGAKSFSEENLTEIMDDGVIVEEKTGHLGSIMEDVKLLWRLLKDYGKGEYRAPWRFVAAIGFAFLYLILPIDIIPDFIPGLGYIDDASVFGLVMKASMVEIKAYKQWLSEKKPPQ